MANEEIRIANMENVLRTTIDLFLEYGIQNTTREMIARASGLSRRSTERYFPTKRDFVVQAAEWFGHDLYNRFQSVKMLESDEYTAIEILRAYLIEFKHLLVNDPRIFVCYAEFKSFLYRNSDDRYSDYMKFADAVGLRRMLQQLLERGAQDGTIISHYKPEAAARYMSNTITSYFSSAVLLYDTKPELMEQYLDDYISDTLSLYAKRARKSGKKSRN
jgi:AcrR family transcriptional regulator